MNDFGNKFNLDLEVQPQVLFHMQLVAKSFLTGHFRH